MRTISVRTVVKAWTASLYEGTFFWLKLSVESEFFLGLQVSIESLLYVDFKHVSVLTMHYFTGERSVEKRLLLGTWRDRIPQNGSSAQLDTDGLCCNPKLVWFEFYFSIKMFDR